MKLTQSRSWTTVMVSPVSSAPRPSDPADQWRTAAPSKGQHRSALATDHRRHPLADRVGVVVLAAATAFTIWVRISLGTMWTSAPVIKNGHLLRTGGPAMSIGIVTRSEQRNLLRRGTGTEDRRYTRVTIADPIAQWLVQPCRPADNNH
jgi:hypothetical protein